MPDFDPYLKWLGIRDPQRPPNHYRLVGVELFEQDTEVIAAAADRQMAHVRSFQNGPEAEISQKVLGEIALARRCLMNHSKRSAYDDQLRQVLPQEPPSQPPVASPPQTELTSPSNDVVISSKGSRLPARKKNHLPLFLVSAACGILLVGGAIAAFVLMTNGGKETNVVAAPNKNKLKDAHKKGAKKSSVHFNSKPDDIPLKKGNDNAVTTKSKNPETTPKGERTKTGITAKPPWKIVAEYPAERPAEFSRNDSEIAKRLQPVYYAVSIRDAEMAQAILNNILNDPKYNGQTDQLPGVSDCIELVKNHKRFWSRYELALAGIKPGTHFLYRGQMVEVVTHDIDDQKLNLKAANGETIDHSTIPDDVYRDLAIGIVRTSLPDPENLPDYIDAFQMFDYKYRQQLIGVEFDLKKALADSEKPISDAAPVEGGTNDPNTKTGENDFRESVARVKVAMPSPSQRTAALRKIKNFYDEKFKLKKNDEKLQFANTLMADAVDEELSPGPRYVMLDEARKIYIALGKPQLAMDAVDKLDEYFNLTNFFDLAEDSLDEVSRKIAGPGEQEALVQQWSGLWNRALAEEKFSQTLLLMGKTGAAVKKMGDANSYRKLQLVKKDVSEMKRLALAADNAMKALDKDENDPQANLALGKYMCFVKNDFKTGIPMLARGSDARLKKAAQLELEVESQDLVDKQIDVARTWYGLSDGKMLQHKRIKLHAAQWFRSAEKNLKGLDKREVEKILKEIELVEQEFDAANVSAFGKFRFLADNEWKIDWRGFESWDNVRFQSDGTVDFMIDNDEQSVPWRLTRRGSIEIVRGRFVAVLIPRRNGTRLDGRRFGISDGKDHGGVVGRIKRN